MYLIKQFNLGREAVNFLVKAFEIREVFIPYYLCGVIRHTLFQAGCRPVFYHIDDNFYPDQEFPKESYILYPNYFGICRNNVKKLCFEYPKLIVDNAHSYFDEPCGFACFNAGHKFGFDKSNLWFKSEEKLVNVKLNRQENIAFERKQKFLKFHKKYGSANLLNIDITSITAPFVYPYLASSEKEADLLVKELTKEGKIIYRYWNSLPPSFREYKFYSRLVPIPLTS